MATEILGLNGDIDVGSWGGTYTSVEKIASADDNGSVMNVVKSSAPTTFKASLESTSYTDVDSVTIRGRLKYASGETADVVLYCKDSGGTTIVSATISVVSDTWTTFSSNATGSWSQAIINGAEWWVEFSTGSGFGIDTLYLTAGEIEVQEADHSIELAGTIDAVSTA